jgi:hypothetical protein
MFHACVERFDVMGERGNILDWDGEVNKALIIIVCGYQNFFGWLGPKGCIKQGIILSERLAAFPCGRRGMVREVTIFSNL